MGDMVQALSRSEAISMPDALVMGAPVCVAKPGSFEAGILDIAFCLVKLQTAEITGGYGCGHRKFIFKGDNLDREARSFLRQEVV